MIRSGIFSIATVCLAISAPISFWTFLPSLAAAQATPEAILNMPEPPPAPEGTVSCFDYYRFGSVQADVQASTPSTVTGVPLSFTGKITNANEYPIVDGAVYVKIFKVNREEEKNTAGPEVVDQFFAARDIHLPANGTEALTVTWAVPGHLPAGDYMLGTYFTAADKFNLLGLSFTDDIVGNMAYFSVVSEVAQSVHFEKPAVTINNELYHFAAYPPKMPAQESVTIEAPLINDTALTQAVVVTWELYAWDALRKDMLIDSKTDIVNIAPRTTAPVIYTTTHSDHPVYYLVGTAHFQDSKSIIGVRFVREGVSKTRINFPGVTGFPLLEGQETTLFSCLHGMGEEALVPDGKLVLALTDHQGDLIHSYTYAGDVSGAMMGVRDVFVPASDYHRFTLKAQLYQGEKLVDEAMMNYTCENLSPSDCPDDGSATASGGKPYTQPGGGIKMLLLIGAGVVALGVAIALGLRRRPRSTMPLVFGLGLILTSAVMWGVLPQAAEAKSVVWNGSPSLRLFSVGSNFSLTNLNVSITYIANIINLDTNAPLADNATVPVNTRLRLIFEPHHYTHIYWFGSGGPFDSPYGDWIPNAEGPTPVSCQPKDFIVRLWDHNFYVPLAVNPPDKTLTGLNGQSCGALTGSGTMDCTMTTPGPVALSFDFAATVGKFYTRYEHHTTGCYGNNNPLVKAGGGGLTPYSLPVPQQSIGFNFTVESEVVELPPNTPVITGPVTGLINTTHTFQVKATDPDNQQVKYCIDWTNDTICDQWLPTPTTFVAPGVEQPFTRLWPTVGAKPFQAKACNVHSLCSGWASHTITIQSPPLLPPSNDYSCTATAPSVNQNEPATFSSSAGAPSAWSALDGSPQNGTGATFSTTFATPGTKTVRLAAPTPPFYDVNGDGYVTPVDLLELINAELTGITSSPGTNGGPWQNQTNRLDVDNDGAFAPSDRLALISYLTLIDPIGSTPLPTASCQVQVIAVTPTPTPTPTSTGGPFNPGPIRETE